MSGPNSTRERVTKIITDAQSELGGRPQTDHTRVYIKGIFNILVVVVPEILYEMEARKEPV